MLAGDPKQLDAVTKSDAAKQMGFSTSWMEQLCNTNLYKRHQETGKFNELYISQLVQNYRSHPEILRIPNELFYENTLQASAKPGNFTIIQMVNFGTNLIFYFCRTHKLVCKLEVFAVKAIPHDFQIGERCVREVA